MLFPAEGRGCAYVTYDAFLARCGSKQQSAPNGCGPQGELEGRALLVEAGLSGWFRLVHTWGRLLTLPWDMRLYLPSPRGILHHTWGRQEPSKSRLGRGFTAGCGGWGVPLHATTHTACGYAAARPGPGRDVALNLPTAATRAALHSAQATRTCLPPFTPVLHHHTSHSAATIPNWHTRSLLPLRPPSLPHICACS